jgi:crossover junction endodeoxyribonuclease RuvC
MPKPKDVPAKELAARFFSLVKKGEPVFVGIDPGASGAIGILSPRGGLVCDIPTIKVSRKGGTKTAFNFQEIADFFSVVGRFRDQTKVVLEEAVVQIKGKGANAYNGYRVGYAFGIWPLFLHAHELPLEIVHPSKWKRTMGLWGKDKEHSRQAAISMFPKVADMLARKGDHDRAEALLLAEYHRRQCGGK